MTIFRLSFGSALAYAAVAEVWIRKTDWPRLAYNFFLTIGRAVTYPVETGLLPLGIVCYSSIHGLLSLHRLGEIILLLPPDYPQAAEIVLYARQFTDNVHAQVGYFMAALFAALLSAVLQITGEKSR